MHLAYNPSGKQPHLRLNRLSIITSRALGCMQDTIASARQIFRSVYPMKPLGQVHATIGYLVYTVLGCIQDTLPLKAEKMQLLGQTLAKI